MKEADKRNKRKNQIKEVDGKRDKTNKNKQTKIKKANNKETVEK